MLTSTRLMDTASAIFTESWQLYESAFPHEERRALADHALAMAHEPHFVCLHLRDSQGFVGILFYWVLSQCVYVEHLAIAPARRGQGLGKAALKLLQQHELPIILEIEPVTDAATARRLRFYEGAGFHRLAAVHYQLPYHRGEPPLRLELLSYPQAAGEALVASFEEDFLAMPMRYRTC